MWTNRNTSGRRAVSRTGIGIAVAGLVMIGLQGLGAIAASAQAVDQACNGAFTGSPPGTLEMSSVPPGGSTVAPGDSITFTITWDPDDWTSLDRLANCFAINGTLDGSLTYSEKPPDNDGVAVHSITVPGDLEDGDTLCARARLSGDPVGQVSTQKSNELCFTVSTEVAPQPGIDVEKTCPSGTATVGDDVTYSITVKNTGDEQLVDVTVDDPLLGGTLDEFSSTLDPGDSETFEYDYTVQANDPDPLENTVTASGTGAGSDEDVSDTDACSVDTTSPPPTTTPPPGEITVKIVKKNDADRDGTYTNSEEAPEPGSSVSFHLVITNTSTEVVTITSLTDAFPGTTIDLLASKCSELAGVSLDPGESVECTFSVNGYSPDATAGATIDTATVCVENAEGSQDACDENDSRVTSAEVLASTVTRGPTRTPPGGLAFTGPSERDELWMAAALLLLMTGMALMYFAAPREEELER